MYLRAFALAAAFACAAAPGATTAAAQVQVDARYYLNDTVLAQLKDPRHLPRDHRPGRAGRPGE